MKDAAGFTLVEMAIALVIVTLLLGGLLVPLAAQVEQRRTAETQKMLEEIRDALTGFAVLHGRLPCPDTDSDPAAAGYGEEEAACNADATAEGFLPWRTLGVAALDAWGVRRGDAASPRSGDWRYRVDRNFSNAVSMITLGTGFSVDSLRIEDGAGNALTTTVERPVAIVFSAGRNTVPDGQNASYESRNGVYQSDAASPGYDDLTIWIARPLLFNRMVAAGRLP